MDYHRLRLLYIKHLSDTLNDDEFDEFYRILETIDESTFRSMVDYDVDFDFETSFAKEDTYKRINTKIDEIEYKENKSSRLAFPISYYYKIAATIALVSLFSYFVSMYSDDYLVHVNYTDNSPVAIDSLRLANSNIEFADGKSMDLEDLSTDTLSYNGISIVRVGNNEIAVNNANLSTDFDPNHFHMFAAKAGSTLKIVLPDKSVVELNSGSSINISTSFGINNRNVLLRGEGFFEVAHNKQVPFIVEVKDAKINVLGTVFNISGYAQDSQIKTTLISGSVAINTSRDHMVIKPGQQARINTHSAITIDNDVDLNKELAWREGVFRFKDETIAEILYELSKWYLIKDIEITDNLKDRFTGSIKRTKQLEDVLSAIEEVSDFHFETKEGRVKVMK